MQKLMFCLFICFIYFNSYGQDKKNWRGFIEINFGIIGNLTSPNYSINSPYLVEPNFPQGAIPSLVLKAGALFKKKHFFALGLENMQMYNSFYYVREDSVGGFWGEGTGPISPYGAIGLYYDYSIISFKRFHVLASVQASLGFTEPKKTFNDSISNSGSSYNSFTGVYTFASYQQMRHEQKDVIFVYGVGVSCSFDIIKEKLILGIGAKFVHAPYSVVKSYHVTYKYMNDPPLDFYTSNGLMAVNFDLRLKYVF